ncbi:SGNH/GDSL hydrolase family protein [Candidatus Magnetominusculus dajiuhuensis]|uniref:SGNH/GDSL hydrolase family protein n=1 Tax=Candidatus Magnetominusculus dajiuhuensis TaxID=3137712 RepID=UPI003B43C395
MYNAVVMNRRYLNVLLVICSVVVVFGVLCVFEYALRLSGSVKPLSNSRELFVVNAFGVSRGNAKNIGAFSFGEKVYTDKYGFRIPKDYKEADKHFSGTILVLGDSIAFGVGVKEEDTFVGLMRSALPDMRVYNSAVVGYNSYDYENVIVHFLPSHPEINRVYLIYCLNDLNSQSAELIDSELNTGTRDVTLLDKARHLGVLAELNEFLRAKSLLYLYLKGLLTDPQMRFYMAESLYYNVDNDVIFNKNIQPIVNIARTLKARNIPFTVIISPYEAQLRKKDTLLGPQKKLSAFFSANGIDFIDPVPDFLAKGMASKEFYLFCDPMHFSEKGHRVMFGALMRRL